MVQSLALEELEILVTENLNAQLKIIERIIKLDEKMLKPSEIGIIITKNVEALRRSTQLWEWQELWEIENLKILIYWSWDPDRRKKLIEALASYKTSALPALVELTNVPMIRELSDLVLEKIKQINEEKI
jgi:hypothetical protein